LGFTKLVFGECVYNTQTKVLDLFIDLGLILLLLYLFDYFKK